MNFKINSRPLFAIKFKLKNDNFMTRDFSPLIERVLTGVPYLIDEEISKKRKKLKTHKVFLHEKRSATKELHPRKFLF